MPIKSYNRISISKDTYNYQYEIKNRIDKEKFRDFVNANKNYFNWYEETDEGKNVLANIDSFLHKEGRLISLNQNMAMAHYKQNLGYYGLNVSFNNKFGEISINFNNSKITPDVLEILLEMAEYCEAMLLINGKKPITKEFIEKEKNELEDKKNKKK
ncbi:MAG: hypothetical protein QM791_16875 [Ferruginibacter sp.]